MKYTKGKTKNLSNNTFLTSKNKNNLIYTGGKYYKKQDTLNKQIKKTKSNLQLRTLERLNKYGLYNIYNQQGGFISHIKFKYKLYKIKKIIKKLGSFEVKLKEFVDSYESQVDTFTRLGAKKANSINDQIRTKKNTNYSYIFKR